MRARCSTVGVDLGIVKKSGAWFTYEGEQLGQGRENAKHFLPENPEVAMQLQAKVYELVGLGESAPGEEADPAVDEEVAAGGEEANGATE